ncbi:probable polygalacturonase At3g15720 [Aristolochia californica]|uniref:probable polygalacturonase At3g15720 n=1 Tax=Aristolochia californica TaxID=171875 RepID=UPI0035DA0CED
MGAMVIFVVLVMLSIAPFGFSYHNVFNVLNFGAIGDAKRDDTEAFKKAWAAACGVGRYSTLLIPRGKTFLVNSYTFTGKCKASRIFFMLQGNLVAPPRGRISNVKSWITFYSVDSLTIIGSGHLDGQGYSWWPKECFVKPEGCQYIGYERPTLLSFEGCNKLNVYNVRLINSPRNHITVDGCNQVSFSGISISAPEKSPNTDGINIARSSFIKITNLNIASGDDCISFLPGTSNVNVSHITCNPGHGISIGSIYTGTVEKVFVEHCNLSNTQNGVRIKTKQGGSGYVRDIHFKDIQMHSVSNPIIIDQYYFSRRNQDRHETEKPRPVLGASTDLRLFLLISRNLCGCARISAAGVEVSPLSSMVSANSD